MRNDLSLIAANRCALCRSQIHDPVCSPCQVNETEIKLMDADIPARKRKCIISRLKSKVDLDTENDARCILCRKEAVSVCHCCFSMSLATVLAQSRLARMDKIHFSDKATERDIDAEIGETHDRILD